MRKLMLTAALLSSLLFSLTASAESMTTYFSAVLKSRALHAALKDGSSLTSMTMTQTFRCPGCYRFEIEAKKMMTDGTEMTRTHAFMTSLDLESQKISVTKAD